MTKKILFVPAALFFLCLIVNCATTSVEQQYSERWEKTYIGMSLDEFKQVWPEAQFTGSGDLQNITEVWTFSQKSFIGAEVEFFTFQDDKLIKYRDMR
jgi:hypothetical protein